MAWAAMAPLAVITGPPTQDTKFTEAGVVTCGQQMRLVG